MSAIVSFYRGSSTDPFGRTIDQLWALDQVELENRHNFIQQLFPLRTPGVAPAPLLDDETCATFLAEPDLRARLLRSLDLMLDFYGLRREGSEIVRGPTFADRSANWLRPSNHNYLRLTRILTSLREMGLGDWARALLRALEAIQAERPAEVGDSMRYWQAAV